MKKLESSRFVSWIVCFAVSFVVETTYKPLTVTLHGYLTGYIYRQFLFDKLSRAK